MRSATWLWLPLALNCASWAQEGYVGTPACASCHERQGRWLQGSVHEKAPVKSGEEPGCEACHGAGSRHFESPATDTIINFRVEAPAARSERCLRCHAGKRARGHARDQVACNDCHARRNSEGFHRLRAGKAAALIMPAVCLRCHPRLPASHAPKPGRSQDCLSCHRPIHGPDQTGAPPE